MNPDAAEARGGAAGEASAAVPLRLRRRSTAADASPGCGVASGVRSEAVDSLDWRDAGVESDMTSLPFAGCTRIWEEVIYPLNSAIKAAGLLEKGTALAEVV